MRKTSALKQNWWETCPCISRVFCRRDGISLQQTISKLDDYQRQGVGAIEIFAPYWGGNQYGALDPYAYYVVDPAIGTMADFQMLIDECHNREMALIVFVNVGYAAMDNPDFLKAQDDIYRGIKSRETDFFLWADSEDAAPPKTFSCSFGKDVEGTWMFSERARKYYWVKWCGFENDVALPQYNFGSIQWQNECKKIIRFWMDTGIDGMIIDAPFCYLNCDFDLNNQCITDIIHEYPNKYIQPEGGGAAGEDLSSWIKTAHYNSLQDYSICRFSHPLTLIEEAILAGDPTRLEAAFNSWRDLVVELGGTTYLGPFWNTTLSERQFLLELITIVTTGAILHDDCKLMEAPLSSKTREQLASVLKLCATTEALRLNGRRERIQDTDGCYIFARYNNQEDQHAVVVLNYTNEEKSFTVALNQEQSYQNVLTGTLIPFGNSIQGKLPPYGYAIYLNK